MRSFSRLHVCVFAAFLLSGCGGGNPSGPDPGLAPTPPPPTDAYNVEVSPHPNTAVFAGDVLKLSVTLNYDFSPGAPPDTKRYAAVPTFHNPDVLIQFFSNGYEREIPQSAEKFVLTFELTVDELIPHSLNYGQCIEYVYIVFWRDSPGMLWEVSRTDTIELNWCLAE